VKGINPEIPSDVAYFLLTPQRNHSAHGADSWQDAQGGVEDEGCQRLLY
jgi:hypothetical protein